MKEKNIIPETGRIMPHDRSAERAIIGEILLERQSIEKATELLTPEMFYDEANKTLFTTIVEMHNARMNIDFITLHEQLRTQGKLDEVGGIGYVTDISIKVFSSVHLESHCCIVRDNYIRRRMIEMSCKEMECGFDETQDVDETLAAISASIEEIQELIVGKNDISHISEPLRESVDKMLNRVSECKNGKTTPGITTGFADLNRITGGFKPGKLIIIAARPGCGKTAIAIHFAMKAAKENHNVAFFTLEMEKTELTDRILIRESGINADRFNSGEIEYSESEDVINAMEKTKHIPVYIEDTARLSVGQIVNRARMLRKKGKCDMVVVDYIQLINTQTKNNRNREQEVSEISRSMKLAAKELKIPFIVLCQMNREFDKEKNREPRLSDIRESGSIEQDADIVIFIHRPKADERQIELCIKKHRAGRLGRVIASHNDSMTNFFDMDYRRQSGYDPVNFYEPKQNDSEMPF